MKCLKTLCLAAKFFFLITNNKKILLKKYNSHSEQQNNMDDYCAKKIKMIATSLFLIAKRKENESIKLKKKKNLKKNSKNFKRNGLFLEIFSDRLLPHVLHECRNIICGIFLC